MTRNNAPHPTFCIGVPTYKRPGDLEKCLEALVPQIRGRENVRLVVVNDASHDAAYEAVLEPWKDAVEYRVKTVNGGPGPTRAATFEGATEDFLVCTDDDCIAPPGWFDMLQAIIEANPEVDLVAGEVHPVWHGPRTLYSRMLAAPVTYPRPAITSRGLLTAVTANSAMRRELYELTGGFNNVLRGATEDCFITQRILESGGTFFVAEHWVMGHKAEQTLREIRSRFRGYGYGGAQNVMTTGNWKLAEVSSDGSLADSLRMIRQKFRWSDMLEDDPETSPFMRFCHRIVTGICAVEYERGWRKGLKDLGFSDNSSLPKIPALADRFADLASGQNR